MKLGLLLSNKFSKQIMFLMLGFPCEPYICLTLVSEKYTVAFKIYLERMSNKL